MKFPVTIRHRASKVKIYAPAKKFAYYRLSYTAAGKRRMQTFPNYSDAKAAAERIAREIAQGSPAASLSAAQSRDALAAFERLAALHQAATKRTLRLCPCDAGGATGYNMTARADASSMGERKRHEAAAEFSQTFITKKGDFQYGNRRVLRHKNSQALSRMNSPSACPPWLGPE